MPEMSDELKWCKCCKQDKPASEFLSPRRKSIRITFCDSCAQANMAKWERTQNVGLRPDQITDSE
jgi:hypothetical protein